jgi:adenylate kinase family enzyme
MQTFPAKLDLDRVVVVGISCSGKTTFSKRLAIVLNNPRFELDDFFWGPNWHSRPTADFRRLAAEAAAGERWVIDGGYRAAREVVWPRATAVVWLNLSFVTVFGRAVVRCFIRARSAELLHTAGNRESFRHSFFSRGSILLHIIKTYSAQRRRYRELRESGQFPQIVWIEFRGPTDAEEFLHSLSSAVTNIAMTVFFLALLM